MVNPSTTPVILKSHPKGLDIEEIRSLGAIDGQQHLDRRLRDLDPMFIIERSRVGRRTVYRLVGERPEGDYDYGVISKTLRAKVLTRDGRRCRMCGKTVDEDHIKLHVDHKIPREWGLAGCEQIASLILRATAFATGGGKALPI